VGWSSSLTRRFDLKESCEDVVLWLSCTSDAGVHIITCLVIFGVLNERIQPSIIYVKCHVIIIDGSFSAVIRSDSIVAVGPSCIIIGFKI
jgi:hypothetical protein